MSAARITARTSRWTVVLFAAIAYVPALLTKPGRMPADTKLNLYLNPGRLIADAPYSWDTRQFGGWVPHQLISYIWPQGPWYWFFDKLGAPDWVAHRLWIGTLLFLAALGVYWAARLLGLAKSGCLVAAIVYQLSPYTLAYVSRTSAMLLPWAALGWLVGLTILAATSERRWRHPALIALVLATCSAPNATAILMIAPAPILWLIHAVVQRSITWRRALATAVRIGALGVAVSLWWIAMVRIQGIYGADVLAYSESLQGTSITSTSTETLRGMGYWLFYFGDPYAFATTASHTYVYSGIAIGVSFVLLIVCIAGLALVRWAQRSYAVLLVLVGIVLAVGVYPIQDASPLMTPLAENSRSSFALAIRSSTRAVPMSNFGLALGIGALITALAATRIRARAFAPLAVVLLAILNLPALFNGNLVDPGIERDQAPPVAWQQAADALSATSPEYRVLQLPGSDFGAFRWGYTVDPPLLGMTTKPLITRDLLPLGSPGVMELLFALDDRMQAHTLDPQALAVVARLLGVDTIWVANDMTFDRFRTPRPEEVAAIFDGQPTGLGEPVPYGTPQVNVPKLAMIDEAALSNPDLGSALAPVELVPILDPLPIMRASDRIVVLVGSGEGVVDAAAAGLLRGDEALRYAADLTADEQLSGAIVIITDSNRDRARQWGTSQDTTGLTESGGDTNDVLAANERDVRLPVFGPHNNADDQTIATLDTGLIVRASAYGETFAYRPEQRPAMAVDGDPSTAWIVNDRDKPPIGHFLTVSNTDGELQLLQPQNDPSQSTTANRVITSVRISAPGHAATDVTLDASSMTAPGQKVSVPAHTSITITITGVRDRDEGTDTGASGVGFAELGLGTNTEVVRVPITDVAAAPDSPLAVVLTRLRVDPRNRWRSDPEPSLEREFTLSGTHEFGVTVTLHRNDRASDAVLAELDHSAGATNSGATANRRLTGVPAAAGRFAVDGDLATAWTSPFGEAEGSTLTVPLNGEPLDNLIMRQVVDSWHSLITRVELTVGGSTFDLAVPEPNADGDSVLALPRTVSGDTLTLSVTEIHAAETVDRRFAEDDTILPVAIAELSAAAIPPPAAATDLVDTCDRTLLHIDGQPVRLQLSAADQQAIARGETVRVSTCDGTTLSLADGTHRVASAHGLLTGIDVNQVVLDDGVAAATDTAAATPAPTVTVERTRTTRHATIAPCPNGCWLIFGEGLNNGWKATVEGRSLGEPRQVAGGFNGWWIEPSDSPTLVELQWQEQTPVTYALIASAAAVLASIALAIGSRRRRQATAWVPTPPRFDDALWEQTSRRRAIAAGVALVAMTAVLVSLEMAALAVVIAAVLIRLRRPGAAGIGALIMIAGIGAASTGRKLLGGTAPGAPGRARLHGPGMVLVIMLLIAALFERGVRDNRPSRRGTFPPQVREPERGQ